MQLYENTRKHTMSIAFLFRCPWLVIKSTTSQKFTVQLIYYTLIVLFQETCWLVYYIVSLLKEIYKLPAWFSYFGMTPACQIFKYIQQKDGKSRLLGGGHFPSLPYLHGFTFYMNSPERQMIKGMCRWEEGYTWMYPHI